MNTEKAFSHHRDGKTIRGSIVTTNTEKAFSHHRDGKTIGGSIVTINCFIRQSVSPSVCLEPLTN
jgi:hypothetical protein